VIVGVISLFFYIADPILGLIMALVLPSILSLDSDGSYGEILAFVLLGIGIYFVRKAAFADKD